MGSLPCPLTADQAAIDEVFHAIITDLVGAPTELVTPDGEIAWHSNTDVWGRTVGTPVGHDVECPLRFPGQYHDAETGLHYNLHRYYDPDTAAYLTPDPLGLAPSPNDHAYVPNPLTFVDPLGLAYEGNTGGSSPELDGGFKYPVSPDEITEINRGFGGMVAERGTPENILINASRYTGFWQKSAVVIRDIAGSHMFDNGNKRTAHAVVSLLMDRNNIMTGPTSDELWGVIARVATPAKAGHSMDIGDIASMLRGF